MTVLTLFTIPKGFTNPHVSLIQRNALARRRVSSARHTFRV
jgi:hypothetical protein